MEKGASFFTPKPTQARTPMRNIARMIPADKQPHKPHSPVAAHWLGFLETEEWNALAEITNLAQEAGIQTLVGGALGLAAYMPLQRRTKDLDFYVRPSDREAMERLLRKAGFTDLYEREPYDRGWISRSFRREVIVDIIWSFANYLTEVDDAWFQHGPFIPSGPKDELMLQVMPPEELIWAKLFVFQRTRCDWPDLLNLLYYMHGRLDRERLRLRLGPHAPLFTALEELFHWICKDPPTFDKERVALLDSRDWFLPAITNRPPPSHLHSYLPTP